MQLYNYLRATVVANWNPIVIGDKCCKCGSTESLELHHVYTFKNIMTDVLEEFDLDYDNCKNLNTNDIDKKLLLSIKFKILEKHFQLDDTQYQTLCKDCHKVETIKQQKGRKRRKKKIGRIILSNKWLNKPLTSEMKKQLAIELNIRNAKGRLLEFPSLKKYILPPNGYVITETKRTIAGKQTRVSIISIDNSLDLFDSTDEEVIKSLEIINDKIN